MQAIYPLLFAAIFLLQACEQEQAVAQKSTASTTEAPDSLLRHVVLFNFTDEASASDIQAIEAAFAGLPEKITEIRGFEWGKNNSPEGLDKGHTHCFFVTFHSEADRDAYLPHPAHQAFVELVGPLVEDVTVVDYWTPNQK